MRVSQAAAALAMCVQAAYAQPEPPLPPPRPAGSPGQAPQAAPNPAGSEHPQGAEADPCLTSLKAAGFEIEPAEPPKTGNELCRIELPVRLREVPVPSRPGASVRLTDEPILACRFAERFGHWIGDLAAPLVAGASRSEMKAVRTGPGFECRNRNGAATGKLSAHAAGLAIDIAAFELANGSILRIKPDSGAVPDPVLASVRQAACGWFTTILGPGSDEAHRDHLHVDIEQHGSSDRYRICQ